MPDRMPTSLFLLSPIVTDPESFLPALAEACAAAPVSAVLLRLAPADERTLVNRAKRLAPAAQSRDAALVLADPGGAVDLATVVMRGGADGGHADDPARLADLRAGLKDGRSTGAGGLSTRHDAMNAGEAGVDYVLFGEPRPDGSGPALADAEERAAWWAEIFQVPCAVYAPTLAAIPRLAATRAEFVALGDAVWTHPDGPGPAVREAARLLGAGQEPVA